MQGIVYDATRVKVCKAFYEICDYAEFARERTDALWMEILSRKQVYRELVYYIAHHTFSDQLKVCGYGLCDLYVWQMNRYNLIKDTGKNPRTCNKEKMAMQAFETLVALIKNPQENLKKLEYGQGKDRL